MIIEILSAVLGSSLIGTITTYFMYRGSEKRIKAAEATLKEIEADAAKSDLEHTAREQLHQIINELNDQITQTIKINGDQIELLNQQLSSEIVAKSEQTARLRSTQDELSNAKDEIIKLTIQISDLKLRLEHYQNWICERDFTDCDRRKPEQKIKCPYSKPFKD